MPASDSIPESNPPANGEPVWSLWTALVFMVLWAALMFVIQTSTVVLAAVLSRPELVSSTDAFDQFFGEFLKRLAANPWSQFGTTACALLTWLITFKLVAVFFRNVDRTARDRALGLVPPKPRWSLAVAAPLGLAVMLGGVVLLELLHVADDASPFDQILQTVPGFAGTAIFALLIAPPAEEAFFRGFLFPPMRRHVSPAVAVLANGAVFAAAHLLVYSDPTMLIPVLMLGTLAAALRAWSGSILPGIVAHVVFNGASLVLFLLSNSPASH